MAKLDEVVSGIQGWCELHQKATAVLAALFVGLIVGVIVAW